jgi:hypothetical protein
MTVLQRKEAGGFIRSARGVAIALTLVVAGVAAGFAIDRAVNEVGAVTYEGPMVERSLAMEAFYGGITYDGPMVERSLAMDAYYRALSEPMVKRSLAMEAFYGGTTYEGPMVKRSLAMEEFYNGD